MQGPSKEWLLKMAELEDRVGSTSVGGLLVTLGLYERPNRAFKVGDVVRMPHYGTSGGFRAWVVDAVCLGGENQEGTYRLRTVDVKENEQIHVPCLILETHPEIEVL